MRKQYHLWLADTGFDAWDADGRGWTGCTGSPAMLEGNREVSAVRFPALPEPDYRNCQPADLPY
jgi:hypothetical protein